MLATFLYPINNVVLSYISVNESDNIKKQYLKTNLFAIAALCLVTDYMLSNYNNYCLFTV